MKKIRLYLLISLVVGLSSCSGERESKVPYYNSPDFSPSWTANAGAIHKVADFSLTNQEGRQISLQDLKGKVHIANFFFSSCTSICPRMAIQFERLQDTFARAEVALLSFSVMPWADGVKELRAYAEAHKVREDQWHLLTGAQASIYELARKSYFAEEELGFTRDSTDFLHTEHFILVDKNHRIRGIYNGTLDLETERLIADVRMLFDEDGI